MNIKYNRNSLAPKLLPTNKIHFNLPPNQLVEQALFHNEGVLGENGEIICSSNRFKGRSPKDKFFVSSDPSQKNIWWGPVNQKISDDSFNTLHNTVTNFLNDKELYVYDGFAGADVNYRLKVRIITTKAWHCHFVNNMFIKPSKEQLEDFKPDFTILNACEYSEQDWKKLGLNSEVFIVFNLEKNLALIGGTEYGGEMKKGIFSVMNYLLPLKNVMPMHCSATVGKDKDVAIYFGLSGTGKTTLSADPDRFLIGDDEHGWSDKGIFNFEGGCYAKTYKLTREQEPDIWDAIRFGAILENVKFDEFTRKVDYFDGTITENGRVSYPISFIRNHEPSAIAGHPKYIFMLTCDAFGVLPPIAKLTPEQASYHFLSGYTAKVAGTERGVTEPSATFSTCFGQPFMTQKPNVYGELLSKKMRDHEVKAYLINTGWIGGKTGSRISLKYTRKIISNVLEGKVDNVEFVTDKVFGFQIPIKLPGIPDNILIPKNSWSNGEEYDKQYKELASMFNENFKSAHQSYSEKIIGGGPKI